MGSALPLIQFKQGLPSKDKLDSLSAEKQQSLLILDDLMELVGSSQNMSDLFCQYNTPQEYQCCLHFSEPIPTREICQNHSP